MPAEYSENFLHLLVHCRLVVIIPVFVTGASLVVLRRLLTKPIMLLRQDLITAAQAIGDDCDTQTLAFASLPYARSDELGDVIAALEQMFGQITAAVATRKQSETRCRLALACPSDAKSTAALSTHRSERKDG